jgi:hypothetical protein
MSTGTIVIHDDVRPPFTAGSYRATTTTTVTVEGAPHELRSERHFEVDAPRFALPPSEIAMVHPPRNGHGAFHATLPHIVLRRRTLPWERALDPANRIPVPTHPPDELAPRGESPWMALLLFEEGEARLLENVPLSEVVPADVFARLGAPAGVSCDAIEIDRVVLRELMPSLDELRLLAHARDVDTDHKASEVGDGSFAVVVANRLPRPGAKHRACLVSLEERSDAVPANPPQPTTSTLPPFSADLMMRRPATNIRFHDAVLAQPRPTTIRLVVLTTWTFEDGDATFPELMARLDVGMFGLVTAGEPPVTDTGHVSLVLEDRAGVDQSVWYRSPLVPHDLARDTLGPYHSADQARRISPETGAEDITYAAAFEVGRLLAMADGRAAADLMRWRRGAYREASRTRTLEAAAAALSISPTLRTHLAAAPAPVLAVAALDRIAKMTLPRADVTGIRNVQAAARDPELLADAWELARPDAEAIARPRGLETVPTPRPKHAVLEPHALTDALDRLLDEDPR